MTHQSQYINDVTTAEFPTAVIQRSHEVPVVVDFWAEWCGPCKTLGPILERLAEEYDGAFELVKIDVDANPELSPQFGIQSIPTVIAFKGGAIASQFTGALPENQVRTWIDELMPTDLDGMVDAARDAALAGDDIQAEQIYTHILAQHPDNPDAGTGLASLLIARGDTDEALIVLGRLTPSPEVDRLQAAARLSAAKGGDISELQAKLDAEPDNDIVRLELARALAASSEFEPGLDHMLHVVRNKGERWEDGRTAMIDIFDVLGNDHPLTLTYRRQLTNALF